MTLLRKIASPFRRVRRWMENWHWRPFRPIGRGIYWLRTHTYNRYHLVDCRNARNGYNWGWIDRSEIILFANMAILKEYVEREADQIDWTWDSEPIRVRKEMEDILRWWDHDRKLEHDAYDELLTKAYGFKDCTVVVPTENPCLQQMVFTRRGDPEWEADCKRCQAAEDALETKDEEMLNRLIKIRAHLWS